MHYFFISLHICVTGGPLNDLQGARAIAEDMIKRLGMSEKLGLRVIREQESMFGGPGGASELGPNTLEAVDAEIKVLLNSSYSRAQKILQVDIALHLAIQYISVKFRQKD